MIINTNVSSLTTRQHLSRTNQDLQAAMERLSSGKRINSAKDDAAGLAISTRMTAQVRGMDVAARNAGDGIALIQTAEGGLGSITDILQRMRELAVQADNGTYSDSDQANLQAEFNQLREEITHISTTSNFNGIKLLDGTNASINLHISDAATDTMPITLQNASATSLAIDTLSIASTGDPQAAITALDTALNTVSTSRANLGSYMNRLNFTIDNLNVTKNNVTAAKSRIEDADMAAEMSNLTRSKILNQSGIAMLSQANQNPQMVLQLLQG